MKFLRGFDVNDIEIQEEDDDGQVIVFASNRRNEKKVLDSFKDWHIVTCANCKGKMSLADANFDEDYAPIHKKGKCLGKSYH